MLSHFHNGLRLIALLAFLLLGVVAQAQVVSVLTQHNDLARTGANLLETTLNTSNVSVLTFGKLFSLPLDGQVYAQPLYVPSVTIPGKGTHNVIYVATAHNTVFAYDADDPLQSTPLWSVNLGPSVPISLYHTHNIQTEVGIIATPVIDLSTGTLYVTAKTLENNVQIYRLHALSITTGAESAGSPVQIVGTVPGTGDGSTIVTFNTAQETNRPGLLLLNGVVYIAFASLGDYTPYYGWVFGYRTSNLQAAPLIYNVAPNGGLGGIWMSGQALAADTSGNIYAMTGNGDSSANTGGNGYSETFLKLVPNLAQGTLTVGDWFMPYDADYLNDNDLDVGSGGPMLLPGTTYLVGGGKESKLYVVDSTNMGQFQADSDSQIVQSFYGYNGSLRGGVVYWNSPNNGPQIYVWGGSDYGKAYAFSNGLFTTPPTSETTMEVPTGYSNSPGMSISANGSTAGTGILWAAMSTSGDAVKTVVPGILRAFDATNLATELWDSNLYPARDGLGGLAKFVPPTIANGKVYMATDSQALAVYGLGPASKQGTSGILSINFEGGSSTNGTPPPMAATETAGVVVAANWNNAGTTAIGSPILLLDNTAGYTGATVSWNSVSPWSTPIAAAPGNANMMKGYLDSKPGYPATTVTITSLPSNYTANGYDVYVYCDGNNGTANRTGSYSIGATTITATDAANNNFSGTFTQAINSVGNYVVFPNQTGSSFTLTATPGAASDGNPRAPINAIQIVAHTTIAGVVTLTGCVNPAQPITFEARPTNGNPSLFYTVTLNPDGSFALTNLPAGTYTLAIKGSKWLRKDTAVDTTGGSVSSLTATLTPGDIDGDNKVDLDDFSLLAAAFNSTPTSANWNANADLNCDGVVDLKDFSLLAAAFNQVGDP